MKESGYIKTQRVGSEGVKRAVRSKAFGYYLTPGAPSKAAPREPKAAA
jgi:hypothetical protein